MSPIYKADTTDNSPNPLVAIMSLTYNHEQYIRDALEGFVMQKTNFPFVAIVHDDASTDGTATIIREYAEKYPDIIKPIFETENQYSKRDGSLTKIMREAIEATGTKYVALCEGDDYWIDPLKLQKQVDFLEANPEYGMCYSRVRYFDQKSGRFKKIWGGSNQTFSELLSKGNTIPTLSTLFRRDIHEKYYDDVHPEFKNWPLGDYPIWLYFAHESKINFMPDVTGVYRVLSESASHTKNNQKWIRFCKAYRDIRLYFANKYNCQTEYEEIIKYSYFRMLLRRYALNNNDLKDECLKALYEQNSLKSKNVFLMRIAIQFKPLYLLLRYFYRFNDIIRH